MGKHKRFSSESTSKRASSSATFCSNEEIGVVASFGERDSTTSGPISNIPEDTALYQTLHNGRFKDSFDKQLEIGRGGFGAVFEVMTSPEVCSEDCSQKKKIKTRPSTSSVIQDERPRPWQRPAPGSVHAIKIIPLKARADERMSDNPTLQEVLGTMRGLNSKHVVLFQEHWLEEPQYLPAALQERCGGVVFDDGSGTGEDVRSHTVAEMSRRIQSEISRRFLVKNNVSESGSEWSCAESEDWGGPISPRSGSWIVFEEDGSKVEKGGLEKSVSFVESAFLRGSIEKGDEKTPSLSKKTLSKKTVSIADLATSAKNLSTKLEKKGSMNSISELLNRSKGNRVSSQNDYMSKSMIDSHLQHDVVLIIQMELCIDSALNLPNSVPVTSMPNQTVSCACLPPVIPAGNFSNGFSNCASCPSLPATGEPSVRSDRRMTLRAWLDEAFEEVPMTWSEAGIVAPPEVFINAAPPSPPRKKSPFKSATKLRVDSVETVVRKKSSFDTTKLRVDVEHDEDFNSGSSFSSSACSPAWSPCSSHGNNRDGGHKKKKSKHKHHHQKKRQSAQKLDLLMDLDGFNNKMEEVQNEKVNANGILVRGRSENNLGSENLRKNVRDIFTELMLGVRHVHRTRLIHRDLKPENVFLHYRASSLSWSVRIADFGLCTDLITDDSQTGKTGKKKKRMLVGTPGYAAPDLVSTEKSDIYSCAVILLEMIACRLMKKSMTLMERAMIIDAFGKNQELPEGMETRYPKISKLILRMSDKKVNNRLSTEEVCKMLPKEFAAEIMRVPLGWEDPKKITMILPEDEKFVPTTQGKKKKKKR